MSNSQQYTLILEPVYGLSGNQIAWVLLTRFVDDADIKHERNPARAAVFFSRLPAEEKWQLFPQHIDQLDRLYQGELQQIMSVNINRDTVFCLFSDDRTQQRLDLILFFHVEISVFFITRVTDADLLILKGLARITPFELDDFGPGYSSFIMMRSGIFECVKIDKAFLGCMAQAIYSTRNIIGMGFILMILIINHGVRPAPPISAENTCAKKRI